MRKVITGCLVLLCLTFAAALAAEPLERFEPVGEIGAFDLYAADVEHGAQLANMSASTHPTDTLTTATLAASANLAGGPDEIHIANAAIKPNGNRDDVNTKRGVVRCRDPWRSSAS